LKPDEIKKLYEPKIVNPKIIEQTYWYIIRRDKATGSVKEKNEKALRISFDLKGNVTQVTTLGF
jgi:hypothetical protein